ncbi:MAG: DUF309 domain-containing protein [Nitrospirota bacterium]|jgi:predicted metal-dependent hydrolase
MGHRGVPPYPDAYLEGIRLFNVGSYYDAHEVLEEIWRTCAKESPERLFYQALIQVAAACLHRERGRWRPALLQYARAIDKLDRIGMDRFLGMDLEGLKAVLRSTFEPLRDEPPPIPAGPIPWRLAEPVPGDAP